MNKAYLYAALLAAAAVLGTAGCGKQAEADTPSAVARRHSKPARPRNLLDDAAALRAAQNALTQQAALKNRKIEVFGNVDFFDGVRPRIELAVYYPEHESGRLFFIYENGRWRQDDSGHEAAPKNPVPHLTALEQIPFDQVPAVAAQWRQKARSVNAVWREPYHIAFVLLPAAGKRFWHTAEIDAQGAQYYFSLHLDHTVWEFKKL